MRRVPVVLAFTVATLIATDPARAEDDLGALLAGIKGWRPELDCRVGDSHIDHGSRSIEFCLDLKQPDTVRCELALFGPDLRNMRIRLSYDVKLTHGWPSKEDWVIVGQVHSRPDPGEAWRCPLLSTEIVGSSLRMFSRSDQQPISDTSKFICAGGSIKSQKVFSDVQLPQSRWVPVQVDMILALRQGSVTASVNGKQVGALTGPTIFNDTSPPFFKFGLYKAQPRATVSRLCVRYRNITIEKL